MIRLIGKQQYSWGIRFEFDWVSWYEEAIEMIEMIEMIESDQEENK
jgi:hypothetical protein